MDARSRAEVFSVWMLKKPGPIEFFISAGSATDRFSAAKPRPEAPHKPLSIHLLLVNQHSRAVSIDAKLTSHANAALSVYPALRGYSEAAFQASLRTAFAVTQSET
jgi:hypothetical protein